MPAIQPIILIIIFVAMALSADAASWRGSVGLGVEFATGTFGAAQTSNAIAIPVTVNVYPSQRLDVSLEIPYLFQRGGNITSSVHRSIAGQQMHMRAQGGAPMHPPSGGAHTSPAGATRAASVASSNGLGDIALKGGYILVEEDKLMPELRVTAAVKFPTADREKALGTGAFDEAAGLELSKWLEDWYALTSAGYTVQGKVEGAALTNYFTYNFCAGYQVSDTFIPLVILKGTSAAAKGTGGTLQARLKGVWAVTEKTALEGYLSKGLTAASPDFGAGLAVFRYF